MPQKYILTRKYKRPMELLGLRDEMRGITPVKVQVPIMFEPLKAVNVPRDVDVSHLVRDGYIVNVKIMRRRVLPKDRPKPEIVPVTEAVPDMSVSTKPKEAKKPEPPPEPENGNGSDYEETDDGGFKCLHCDKEYKPSKRAEALVIAHVEKEHL